MSIVFISSELEEVVRCSSRVAVMRDRRKIAELSGKEVTQDRIIEAIAGTGGTYDNHRSLRRAARRPRQGW